MYVLCGLLVIRCISTMTDTTAIYKCIAYITVPSFPSDHVDYSVVHLDQKKDKLKLIQIHTTNLWKDVCFVFNLSFFGPK